MNKQAWDLFVTVMLLYATFAVPFFLAFVEDTDPREGISGYAIWDLMLDCIFCFDICLSFVTCYSQNGRYISDLGKIANNYLRGWFWVDVPGSIPFDKIVMLVTPPGDSGNLGSAMKAMKFIRILKMVRAVRFLRKLDQLEQRDTTGTLTILFKIFRAVLSAVFSAHFLGCMFYMIFNKDNVRSGDTLSGDNWISAYYLNYDTEPRGTPVSVFKLYITSVYWGLATTTTVGFGDTKPVTHEERIWFVAVMLWGGLMFSFATSIITSTLMESTGHHLRLEERLYATTEYMEARNMPVELRRTVLAYIGNTWRESGDAYNERDVLFDLPSHLRLEYERHLSSLLHMGGQYQTPLLFGLNSTSAAAIYSRLEPIEFRHGVVVYRRGDDGGCLYTIAEGAVSLVDGRGAKRTCAADGSGALSLFGEESLFDDIWPSRPETASVLTMHASTLQLSAENIEQLARVEPVFVARLRQLCQLRAACLGLHPDATGKKASSHLRPRRCVSTLEHETRAVQAELLVELGIIMEHLVAGNDMKDPHMFQALTRFQFRLRDSFEIASQQAHEPLQPAQPLTDKRGRLLADWSVDPVRRLALTQRTLVLDTSKDVLLIHECVSCDTECTQSSMEGKAGEGPASTREKTRRLQKMQRQDIVAIVDELDTAHADTGLPQNQLDHTLIHHNESENTLALVFNDQAARGAEALPRRVVLEFESLVDKIEFRELARPWLISKTLAKATAGARSMAYSKPGAARTGPAFAGPNGAGDEELTEGIFRGRLPDSLLRRVRGMKGGTNVAWEPVKMCLSADNEIFYHLETPELFEDVCVRKLGKLAGTSCMIQSTGERADQDVVCVLRVHVLGGGLEQVTIAMASRRSAARLQQSIAQCGGALAELLERLSLRHYLDVLLLHSVDLAALALMTPADLRLLKLPPAVCSTLHAAIIGRAALAHAPVASRDASCQAKHGPAGTPAPPVGAKLSAESNTSDKKPWLHTHMYSAKNVVARGLEARKRMADLCEHQGMMQKKGEINTSYKRRFFWLHKGVLAYYKPSQIFDAWRQPKAGWQMHAVPQGRIDLAGAKISQPQATGIAVTASQQRKPGTHIIISSGGRDYHCECDTYSEATNWVRQLDASVKAMQVRACVRVRVQRLCVCACLPVFVPPPSHTCHQRTAGN